ncbi:MAG TPA: hypothetical protein PKO06_11425, partial [Candidatus Ozemobacteraceae bacterium]|nr:hypothetical protein [Candidatus Ozemobacteraceae bacterium]
GTGLGKVDPGAIETIGFGYHEEYSVEWKVPVTVPTEAHSVTHAASETRRFRCLSFGDREYVVTLAWPE